MDDKDAGRLRTGVMAAATAGIVAAAAMLWLMHARMLPLGVFGEWTWSQRDLPLLPAPSVLVAALLILAGAVAALDAVRKEKIRRAQALIGLLVLAVASYALPQAMLVSEPAGYGRATLTVLSDLSMGYLSEASKMHALRPWLEDTARRTNLGVVPARVATHPPGPVLFFRLLSHLARKHPGLQRIVVAPLLVGDTKPDDIMVAAKRVSSGALHFHHIAAACLSIWVLGLAVPAAMLGTWLFAWWWLGPREATTAAVLIGAVPALWVFTPGIDVRSASLTAFALAFWALAMKRPGWAWVAGIVWGVSLQWSYGLSALIVLFAAMWLVRGRSGGWRPWVGLIVGVVVAHLPLMLLGYHPLANFAGSMAAQRTIMAGRHYMPWLIMNAWDILLFSGPALVALAAAASGRARGLGTALTVTIALLLLSGATRGEVGRIYCFLAAPMAVCAAAAMTVTTESPFLLSGTVAIAAQLAAALGLGTYLMLVTP